MKENIENVEKVEAEDVEKVVDENVEVESSIMVINNINDMKRNSDTKCRIFTNITDNKKLFNLNNNVDVLLNDCEGEIINVKEVLIKKYEKKMKKPLIDEETGEIIKDIETTMSCILVDDNNKSYATGSKIFTMNFMNYLQMGGMNELETNGIMIKIIKTKKGDNNNKSLTFELI